MFLLSAATKDGLAVVELSTLKDNRQVTDDRLLLRFVEKLYVRTKSVTRISRHG